MKLIPQKIDGLFEVQLTLHSDARGAFARTFCADIFAQNGLKTTWSQMNMSQTNSRGAVRGLHFQRAPKAEAKLIRATEGSVFDVAVDLRAGSASFGHWVGITLSAEVGNAVYIPEGVAHGFQTLTDAATLHYCHSEPYAPDLEGGVTPLDPSLNIDWPLPVGVMSERDQNLSNLQDIAPL